MILKVYTDASYSDNHRIAAIGFTILCRSDLLRHEIKIVGIENSTCAEYAALSWALQEAFLINNVDEIHLYTDVYKDVLFKHSNKYEMSNEAVAVIRIIEDHEIKIHYHRIQSHSGNYHHNFVDQTLKYELRKAITSKSINQ